MSQSKIEREMLTNAFAVGFGADNEFADPQSGDIELNGTENKNYFVIIDDCLVDFI